MHENKIKGARGRGAESRGPATPNSPNLATNRPAAPDQNLHRSHSGNSQTSIGELEGKFTSFDDGAALLTLLAALLRFAPVLVNDRNTRETVGHRSARGVSPTDGGV